MSKRKRRLEDNILGIGKASVVGAGLASGLGAVGGVSASAGQQGIQRATAFLPAIGTVIGAKMLIDQVRKLKPKKKDLNFGY